MAAAAVDMMDMIDEEALKGQKRTSKYRGVCWNKKNRRWQASINVGGRYHYLGSFLSEDHAARAFDKAAYEIRGKRAKLNFADSPELIASGALGEAPAIRPEALTGAAGVSGSMGRNNSVNTSLTAGVTGVGSGDVEGSPDTQQPGSSKPRGAKRRKSQKPMLNDADEGADFSGFSAPGQGGDVRSALQACGYNIPAESPNGLTPNATMAVMSLLGGAGDGRNGGTGGAAWPAGSGDDSEHANAVAVAQKALSSMHQQQHGSAMPSGGHLTSLFTNFGETSCVTRLIPDSYQQHRLLGAVIENVRDSSHWAAAVWDGKRVHTLEGFLDEATAERSARDLIDMLLALKTGSPALHHGAPPGAAALAAAAEAVVDNAASNADAAAADAAAAAAVAEPQQRPAKMAKIEQQQQQQLPQGGVAAAAATAVDASSGEAAVQPDKAGSPPEQDVATALFAGQGVVQQGASGGPVDDGCVLSGVLDHMKAQAAAAVAAAPAVMSAGSGGEKVLRQGGEAEEEDDDGEEHGTLGRGGGQGAGGAPVASAARSVAMSEPNGSEASGTVTGDAFASLAPSVGEDDGAAGGGGRSTGMSPRRRKVPKHMRDYDIGDGRDTSA